MTEFQFHTGSIKSRSSVRLPNALTLFQFHTGSIKSLSLNILSRKRSRCFNSILVRLKDPRRVKCRKHNPSFNSILVRLKETYATALRSVHITFQFHTGSIKRRCTIPCRTLRTSFNSILVRLKVCQCTANF